jgi:hypothetical protein
MYNLPTLCVDDFYDNPDSVREFALSLNYDVNGNYPGMRTSDLSKIDEKFYFLSCNRILSSLFDLNREKIMLSISMHFQKIYPYSNDIDDPINSGWFHLDDPDGSAFAAGVIYLNPNSNLDAGTIIAKQTGPVGRTPENTAIRRNFYTELYKDPNYDRSKYRNSIISHNNNFTKTLEFKNVYNRMIFYDSMNYHKENSFFAHDSEPRLTQVFFIKFVEYDQLPIDRAKVFQL